MHATGLLLGGFSLYPTVTDRVQALVVVRINLGVLDMLVSALVAKCLIYNTACESDVNWRGTLGT